MLENHYKGAIDYVFQVPMEVFFVFGFVFCSMVRFFLWGVCGGSDSLI